MRSYVKAMEFMNMRIVDENILNTIEDDETPSRNVANRRRECGNPIKSTCLCRMKPVDYRSWRNNELKLRSNNAHSRNDKMNGTNTDGKSL